MRYMCLILTHFSHPPPRNDSYHAIKWKCEAGTEKCDRPNYKYKYLSSCSLWFEQWYSIKKETVTCARSYYMPHSRIANCTKTTATPPSKLTRPGSGRGRARRMDNLRISDSAVYFHVFVTKPDSLNSSAIYINEPAVKRTERERESKPERGKTVE